MITKVWRYSHLSLAIISSLFLLVAVITGIILGVYPIKNQIQAHNLPTATNQSIASVLNHLNSEYEDILELEVNNDLLVKISTIDFNEAKNGDFYINPSTGKKIDELPKKSNVYNWAKTLHRSLFLKNTGRIFVGISSFLLFLIAISGLLLLIKRQKGLIQIFKRIKREDFFQFYHVTLGKFFIIPIIIISISGAFLSLYRFSSISEQKSKTTAFTPTPKKQNIPPSEFDIFKTTKLKDIKKLEFPFSSSEEDFYILYLSEKQLSINQKTGDLISQTKYPIYQLINNFSFNLHTGEGNLWWSIILIIACFNIIFFMYSGGIITYKRLKSRVKSLLKYNEAEIIILIGSENGSTMEFGKVLYESFFNANQKVFITDLNKYKCFPKMKQLIILTSTYGDGDPPSNATRFLSALNSTKQITDFNYTIVGLGSAVYPNFCGYALEVEKHLRKETKGNKILPTHLINNKSYDSFKNWVNSFIKETNYKLVIPTQISNKNKLSKYKILSKNIVKDEYAQTFLLIIKPPKNQNFKSGDLLAIYPSSSKLEKFYSIAKTHDNKILLSIKLHTLGECSNYLNNLGVNKTFKGYIKTNKKFHQPQNATSFTLVGNGTGIAPFLGFNTHSVPTTIYWGGKTKQSYKLYKPIINTLKKHNINLNVELAFSKENTENKYVYELINKNQQKITNQLQNGGVIMICGSIEMQKNVMQILEKSIIQNLSKSLDEFINNNQIMFDCY